MKAEKWYKRRLEAYFEKNYSQFDDLATFWNDPAPNQWLFDIPELGVKVELTCDDKGKVSELRYPIL